MLRFSLPFMGRVAEPVGRGRVGALGKSEATPSITVPAGEVQGLPVGVVFMGAAFSEAKLIGIAYAFEQATRAHKPPQFRERVAD